MPFFEESEIGERGCGDVLKRLLREEGLMSRHDHVRKGRQSREHVVRLNFIR
ncbi:hypothetical protein D3C83_267900 [compost metagenome]